MITVIIALMVLFGYISHKKHVSKPNFWCEICGGSGRDPDDARKKCYGCP